MGGLVDGWMGGWVDACVSACQYLRSLWVCRCGWLRIPIPLAIFFAHSLVLLPAAVFQFLKVSLSPMVLQRSLAVP